MSGRPSTPARKPYSNGAGEHVSWPACSVIVPVYNHWALVPELLECLQAQSYPQESFEVLLVDNGSTDYHPPQRLPANVRILHCETPGSYAARNVGTEAAEGEWLAFTDADCRPASEWLEAFLDRAQQEGNSALLAGAVEMYTESARPNAYETYDLVRGIPQEKYVRRGYAATANLLVHRRAMDEMGGFDATRYSGGDADFCRRASTKGYSLRYVSKAVVYHPARQSWMEVASKARRIKGGQLLSGPLHTRLYWAIRTVLPPLALYCRLARSPTHSLRCRIAAVLVQTRLWGHEVVEAARLMMKRANRERR